MAANLDLVGRLSRRRFRPALYLKRFLPRTLLGRSLLIIVTPLILLQVITTYSFYESHWDLVIRRLSSGLAGDVAMAMDLMRRRPGAEEQDRLRWLMRVNMGLQVDFAEGEILPSTPPPKRNELVDVWLRNALRERIQRPFHIGWIPERREVRVDVQMADGVLHVVASRERLFNTRTYIFILWMVGSSLILFTVAMLFMRNQVRPLRRLAQAADSFGKGRDVPDFKPEGATEARQAAAAFNLMRGRIRRQIQQRTEMLAGVSHDLRTPLTRMKLQLAMLGDGPEVGDLRSDVAEMERMIGGYLAFARGEGEEDAVDTDFSQLLGEVVGSARRDGAVIDLHVEGPIVLPLRPEAFRRCLANLVGNATRYGGQVWVRAARRGVSVQVTIDDDGPGVPANQREDVFKPFYRIDPSRNPATGGVGLGLSIARDVVHRHGGEIVLEQSPFGGLRVRLGLPI